jgi:hypothetical protein
MSALYPIIEHVFDIVIAHSTARSIVHSTFCPGRPGRQHSAPPVCRPGLTLG